MKSSLDVRVTRPLAALEQTDAHRSEINHVSIETQRMSKRKFITIVCFLLIFSCNKTPTNLPLTDDAAKNNKIIKAFIPSGTLASNAITKMEQEGFACKIMRDEKVRSAKDSIQASKRSNIDFVWCERKTGTIFSRRWQVIMSLDSEDKIDNISVTMGL